MAHRTSKTGYQNLADRINRFPQGAPESELLYKILKMLFSEREAELVSMIPIKPFKVNTAARLWKMKEAETQNILDTLASRAILLDVSRNGESVYVLPPPMAGFFEFSLMRIRDDIDQKLLSELFYQYLNVEEDFVKALFTEGNTQLGRTFVHEPVLTSDQALHVLDYERASEVIKTASTMGVGICYCRHKKQHVGQSCEAPMDICMTFGGTARSLIKYDYARKVGREEGLDLLQKAYEENLVQFGENVQQKVAFICNCCGCCCEAMIAARKYAFLDPVHTTNFIPEIDTENCSGCGKCVNACPVEALSLVSANDPAKYKRKLARLDSSVCLGCGVCVRNCKEKALSLKQREERVLTPVNTAQRIVEMAIDRGKLQHLVFDNHLLKSHRAMAAMLGVILKLPPLKQTMANQQMRSRYMEKLLTRSRH